MSLVPPCPARPSHLALVVVLVACGGNPVTDDVPGAARGDGTTAEGATTDAAGARVTPPFDVRGELDGLLLVWFDADGLHSAQKRADIPEASRAEVRVDSLKIPPDKRLDPEHVYVADVRAPGADGSYAVTKRTRAWFESRMDALAPKPAAEPAAAGAALADTGVTLYRTSWCGVCVSAAKYFRQNDIAFVEKDIEKDPGAQAEMLQKAQSVGRKPTGVPVIDFHGHLMFGFDRATIESLVRKQKAI